MNEKELIYTLPTGDPVYRYQEAVVVMFGGKRKVLSTGGGNGGYTEHLQSVFNHQSGYGYCTNPEDAPVTYEEYITDFVNNRLGLSLATTTGMATIVSMENVCIEKASYKDLSVTAIVTASLEVNGGRVCDPAQYYEEKGKENMVRAGTINIMLHINANMTPGCMTRAVVTLTEAKSAAIAELLGSSLYSHGIATGSGSDSVIITADADSDFELTYAGKHGKLGEMIGITVKTAVKKALGKHMGLTPESQHSIEKRTFRYGLTQEKYWEAIQTENQIESLEASQIENGIKSLEAIQIENEIKSLESSPKDDITLPIQVSEKKFKDKLNLLDQDGLMVSCTSLYIHLMDQLDWGLLDPEETEEPAAMLLSRMAEHAGVRFHWRPLAKCGRPEAMEELAARFREFMILAGASEA